ncbi:MAG: hypothetical protein H0T71_09910 [Acidobacteria bacterium]|nr:hypothetical protein [Acidobacteriota bacterium]
MIDRSVDLEVILKNVRRRWAQRSRLRAWTVGAAAATAVVLAGIGAIWLLALAGIPLVVTTALVSILCTVAIGRAMWACRGTPSDRQIARFIEEREPGLDDVVVTAVEYSARPDASPRMRDALLADASRAFAARDLDTTLDRIVSRGSIRQAARRAAAAAAALALVAVFFAPSFSRATNVASAYLFPARLTMQVTPGTTKLRAGQSVTITARISGLAGELVPTLAVAVGEESRTLSMTAGAEPGVFALTLPDVDTSFAYSVHAASVRSDTYAVNVIRPPRVERIDLHYEFPRNLGLEPRTDEDSGDIYGPPGTRVRLAIAADKPIATAFLLLDDGRKIALDGESQQLDGALTIEADGSYRVALADHDGLETAGDTEYYIRTLDDRPPDVRILRPATDKQVTPLEEVHIEARADDDFGVAALELVFQAAQGKERVVPLHVTKSALTAAGRHTLFIEDLKVQPGDFVTYYARARDANRGRRSSEARSDIFFLEVKPFEEEFVAAQSQQMGQGAGQSDSGLARLADAQKEIIVATWNLDARARRARGDPVVRDIQAISRAQANLRQRAEQAAARAARTSGDPRRRRSGQRPAPGDDPLGKAVEAMGRAVHELDKPSTADAVPHEKEALSQLLKAEAENRRRQVTRGQQAGGGGGGNRAGADLSSLFDQELRKRQQTNYETPNSTEERQETRQDDPLQRIRDLARRQDALNREQGDLAKSRQQMAEAEVKRQLERLTREQNELRQQAEQLAQQMQQSAQPSEAQSGQASAQSSGQTAEQSSGRAQQEGRRLRQISEDMRNAATGMGRQNGEQAAESGSRASERLRDLERQMQTTRPDDRRRALGDLQLETRQLADAQRRLASEASRAAHDSAGDDARRRLAGEQERLADRAEQLQQRVQDMAKSGGQGKQEQRQATADASRELERQKVAERMRQSAESLRQGNGREPEGQAVAKALDRVAERLGAASGTQNADSRRHSDQLTKTQELRDKVQDLTRSIEQLRRAGDDAGEPLARAGQQRQQGGPDQSGQQAQTGQQQGQSGQQGRQAPGQQGQPGQPGSPPPSQAGPPSPQQQNGSGGQGGSPGGGSGRLEQLQRDVNEQMRQAERMAGEIRRENSAMGTNDAAWWRSFSAPGTEGFKQDFARWESLKKNLLVALEDVDSQVSGQLRALENKERLNAGGHDGVSEAYRELVDKYYRSLAAPRKPR